MLNWFDTWVWFLKLNVLILFYKVNNFYCKMLSWLKSSIFSNLQIGGPLAISSRRLSSRDSRCIRAAGLSSSRPEDVLSKITCTSWRRSSRFRAKFFSRFFKIPTERGGLSPSRSKTSRLLKQFRFGVQIDLRNNFKIFDVSRN